MTLKYTDPLEWVDEKLWFAAQTPFGGYHVAQKEGSPLLWTWRYCFVEYYDEESGLSASEADAKAYCQNDWDTRIQPILERFAKRCPAGV